MLEEAKGVNTTWAEIKADAKKRVRWKILVEALCSAAEWRDAIIIINFLHQFDTYMQMQIIGGQYVAATDDSKIKTTHFTSKHNAKQTMELT